MGRVLWFVCNVALKPLSCSSTHTFALSQNQTLHLFNGVGTLVLTQCFITLIALTSSLSASLSQISSHYLLRVLSSLSLTILSDASISFPPLSAALQPQLVFLLPLEQW